MAKNKEPVSLSTEQRAKLAALKTNYKIAQDAVGAAEVANEIARAELEKRLQPIQMAWQEAHQGLEERLAESQAQAQAASEALREFLLTLWRENPTWRTIEPGLVIAVSEARAQPLTEGEQEAAIRNLIEKYPWLEKISPALARAALNCLKLDQKLFAELDAALQLNLVRRQEAPTTKINPKEWLQANEAAR